MNEVKELKVIQLVIIHHLMVETDTTIAFLSKTSMELWKGIINIKYGNDGNDK